VLKHFISSGLVQLAINFDVDLVIIVVVMQIETLTWGE